MKKFVLKIVAVALLSSAIMPQDCYAESSVYSQFYSFVSSAYSYIAPFTREVAITVVGGLLVAKIIGMHVQKDIEAAKVDIKEQINQQWPTVSTSAVNLVTTTKQHVLNTCNDLKEQALYPVNAVVDPVKRALAATKRLGNGIKKDGVYTSAVLSHVKEFSVHEAKRLGNYVKKDIEKATEVVGYVTEILGEVKNHTVEVFAEKIKQPVVTLKNEFHEKSEEYEEIGQDAGKALLILKEKMIYSGDYLGGKLGDVLETVENCITQ